VTPSINVTTSLGTPPLSLASRAASHQDLSRADRAWTVAQIETSARSRGTNPESRLLAIFEVLDDLFNRADREARKFVVTLAEMSQGRPLDTAGTEILVTFRALIDTFAAEASLRDPAGFALSWRILMNGTIIKAIEGDLDSALRAKEMARDLIARHSGATQRPVEQLRENSLHPTHVFDYELEWMSSAEVSSHVNTESIGTEMNRTETPGARTTGAHITGSAIQSPASTDSRRYCEVLAELEWDLG
jgi:hypothetical protein